MTTRLSATCLELVVGPYALAVRAAAVLAVREAVSVGEPFAFQQRTLPVCDLGHAFGAAPRAVMPFALVLDTAPGPVVIGVDRIAHLHGTTTPAALPSFGLRRPQLFEGALREGGRLLLLLSPSALAAYVGEQVGAAPG
jgi:hypothetical protein